ncbi:unnamed protein product, partial [marine sediment metagenome]
PEKKIWRNLYISTWYLEKYLLKTTIKIIAIKEVGEETSQDLTNYFRNLENLKKVSKEKLIEIRDIGPETAESIYNWFSFLPS